MHITHIREYQLDVNGLCGAPITPKPEGANTAQCTACYKESLKMSEEPHGK